MLYVINNYKFSIIQLDVKRFSEIIQLLLANVCMLYVINNYKFSIIQLDVKRFSEIIQLLLANVCMLYVKITTNLV